MSLLEVSNLTIRTRHGRELVKGIDFTVEAGEWFALIGESGSGKSITASALTNLTAANLVRTADALTFDGIDLLTLSKQQLRTLRGEQIAYVFQDYQSAFTPYYTVANQMHEMLKAHRSFSVAERRERIASSVEAVGLDPALVERYPFQVSGGQLQRLALASAVLLEPTLLIADEPTTALDSWSSSVVLDELAAIKQATGCSILFITHDLRIMNRYADRVAIMQQGRIVEHGSKDSLVLRPEHPYTRDLLDSIPPLRSDASRLPVLGEPARLNVTVRDHLRTSTASSAPVLRAENLVKVYGSGTRAVDGVNLSLPAGSCLGLVGESGSGKSTLARCLLSLERITSGELWLGEQHVNTLSGAALRSARQRMQLVLQNPNASFNERLPILASLMEPLECLGRRAPSFLDVGDDPRTVAAALLDLVQLPADYLDKLPTQLSGGEKQRVSIARAISTEPSFIVLDEPTASLDVSTQARVLNLLKDLQDALGLSYLFISHDLSSVHFISQHLIVMKDGVVVDDFDRSQLFDPGRHDYTRQLIELFEDLPQRVA
ncbi:MAG: ABC transporter ATP-binding protein [Propioniciclava sp.]|uniref:ATP-binding cassette domain-containing protein n=1 Tax=Propioniciclava sp. TaxID=2038686 RepID=UPI0039E59DFF